MGDKKIDKEDRDNPLPSKCLGIFNLCLETTEKDLHELFFRYGEIEDVSLVTDKVSSKLVFFSRFFAVLCCVFL